jgi:hypothetical protein
VVLQCRYALFVLCRDDLHAWRRKEAKGWSNSGWERPQRPEVEKDLKEEVDACLFIFEK